MLTYLPHILITFISATLILAGIVIYLIHNYKKISNDFKTQNLKSINLFLDKKLVMKLLEKLTATESIDNLELLIDDIINYFGIEFAALKIKNIKQILRFRNNHSYQYITDKETVNLFSHAENEEDSVFHKDIKEEDEKKFMIFKYNNLSMLVVLEEEHNLTGVELDTLSNEIMLILQLALHNSQEFNKGNLIN